MFHLAGWARSILLGGWDSASVARYMKKGHPMCIFGRNSCFGKRRVVLPNNYNKVPYAVFMYLESIL